MDSFGLSTTYNFIVVCSCSVLIFLCFLTRNVTKLSFNNHVKFDVIIENIELATLMYTTKLGRLSVLFLPPIFTVIFVQLNNKMYDYDKLNVEQSLYFLTTNILMAVFMNSVSGILTWYLTDYRMKELVYELEEMKIKLGTFLPTGNKKRIEKAIKNVWQITNIYFIPVNLYKSIISIVGSLIIIDGVYFKVGLILVYGSVMIISHIFVKYTAEKKVKDITFDPKSKNGYEEEKTKEESDPLNITSLGNTNEVYSRLTFGHTITNDIDSKMDNETKRAIKNAFRNTLIDTAGAIIFIGLLNVSSRSVAQSASSLCWIISMAFDSFNKWKKVYYLQEHAHILKKLSLHSHQCKMNTFDSVVLNVQKIELSDVCFEYQSDILIDSDCEPQPAIRNLSCKFEKGKLNYITGENGGGKSSLFKTLLYNIKSGSIYFDGISRSNIDWLTLRRSIYYLSQVNEHPALLSDDILTKLKEDNVELAKQFGLSDIKKVSGDGQGGSGGQEQRIHIFTALTSRANVVLLDEPFSALDIEWTNKVENILLEIAKSKIIIMVGHDCFHGKEQRINTYTITPFKKSASGNTELQCHKICNDV